MSSILPNILEGMDLHPLYPISWDVCDTYITLKYVLKELLLYCITLSQKTKTLVRTLAPKENKSELSE